MTTRSAPSPAAISRRHGLGLAGAALASACAFGAAAGARPVHVFAAASLKTALDAVIEALPASMHASVGASATYAGSSLLARQILQGAPADIFISANTIWMDEVARAGLIQPDRRVDLLGNRLVLIAPAAQAVTLRIAPGFPLVEALGPSGRLAMALVDAVPAGIYGREALASLGVWQDVAPHVAQTDNVRSALRLVASGEAPLGIVYATDALADPTVQVVGILPDETHSPIRYPAAMLTSATPEAEQVWDALTGAPARAIFAAHGFLTPGPAP